MWFLISIYLGNKEEIHSLLASVFYIILSTEHETAKVAKVH